MCLECHPSHYAVRSVCTGCHGGNPGSGRKNIAHHRLIAGRFARFTLGDSAVVRKGVQLMGQFACRRCHVSNSRGNRLATSLDTVPDARSPEEIMSAIRMPALGMPDFGVTEEQAVALVNTVLYGAGQADGHGGEPPLVLHFEAGHTGGGNIFSRTCGS
jgi:mono/diheme cytochrome c family protein